MAARAAGQKLLLSLAALELAVQQGADSVGGACAVGCGTPAMFQLGWAGIFRCRAGCW